MPKRGTAPEDATLGNSQMSVNGVRKLSEEFPQLRDERTLGYGFNPDVSFSRDDRNHEHPLTPKEVRHIERQGKHADKELLPTEPVLQRSPHVANIQRWLDWLKKNGSG